MDNPALNELVESLKEGQSSKASSSLRTLLSQGVDIKTILVDGIFKAVLEIGEAICSVPEYSEEEKVDRISYGSLWGFNGDRCKYQITRTPGRQSNICLCYR